jgi:8-oxo-dGDP phosphatase
VNAGSGRPALPRTLGPLRWIVHGERALYSSPWVGLRLADVEIPGGERFEHHIVRVPREAAGCVVHDPERGVLLLWRHRFITDTWGWEIPAGAVDDGENPAEAAAREVREETGWRPGPIEHLVTYQPSNGLSDQRFNVFLARGAEREGDPVDFGEAERIAWRTPTEVRDDIAVDQVADGLSLTALLFALAFDRLGPSG